MRPWFAIVILLASFQSPAAVVTNGLPTRVILNWDYPISLPCAGLKFEVWTQDSLTIPSPVWSFAGGKTNLQAPPIYFPPFWVKLVTVPQPPVGFVMTKENQFFIVRATNEVTGKVSGWGTNSAAMKPLK